MTSRTGRRRRITTKPVKEFAQNGESNASIDYDGVRERVETYFEEKEQVIKDPAA